MPNTLMSLLVKLGVDSTALSQGLALAESSSMKSMATIGQGMMKAGAAMTVGLTLPLVAAGLKMVNLASNMVESVSKVNVVFGESSLIIKDWSKTAASSLGMSQQQALEAAGTYGNLFQAMGLTRNMSVDMSKSVVQLAADLASFNNASPEETLLALRSGLSGEMEPLKKYGVAMNDATLSQMAMTMGLGDNMLVLSEAQKMQVRYAVIMDQTSMAQGDFARTADGMANSTRILKAELSDASAMLGEQLLPIGLKVVTWAKDLLTRFEALTPAQQKTIVVIGGIVAALGPMLIIAGKAVTVFGGIAAALTTLEMAAGIAGAAFVTLALSLLPIIGLFAAAAAVIAILATQEDTNDRTLRNHVNTMDRVSDSYNATASATIHMAGAFDAGMRSTKGMEEAHASLLPHLKLTEVELQALADKAEALRKQIIDETAWEVMYTGAKSAAEQTQGSFDLLGSLVQGLSADGAEVWKGFLEASGAISVPALTEFAKIQDTFITLQDKIKTLGVTLAIEWLVHQSGVGIPGQAEKGWAEQGAYLNKVYGSLDSTSGVYTIPGSGVWESTDTGGRMVYKNSRDEWTTIAPGYALGGSFMVPPGFLDDSFPMMVQSGEVVSVTPAGQTEQGGSQVSGDTNITIINPTPASAEENIRDEMLILSFLGKTK
jgi:hypothetical protein